MSTQTLIRTKVENILRELCLVYRFWGIIYLRSISIASTSCSLLFDVVRTEQKQTFSMYIKYHLVYTTPFNCSFLLSKFVENMGVSSFELGTCLVTGERDTPAPRSVLAYQTQIHKVTRRASLF